MSSIGSQAFINELQTLLEILKKEKHPAVYKLLPFCQDQYMRELKDFSATLNCIRQELLGLQSSIQNLTMLVVSQQQQLHHPSSCNQFSLQTISPQRQMASATSASLMQSFAPPANLLISTDQQPSKKQTRPRKQKKQPNPQSTFASDQTTNYPLPTAMDNTYNNLDDLVREYCVDPANVAAIDVSLFN